MLLPVFMPEPKIVEANGLVCTVEVKTIVT